MISTVAVYEGAAKTRWIVEITTAEDSTMPALVNLSAL